MSPPPLVLDLADTWTYGALLWALLGLFVLRVLGQVVVALAHPRWLPEMKQWYSGLIPYPALLPIQIAFIWIMALMARDVARGFGTFAAPHQGWASGIVWFSYRYAGAMVVRHFRWRNTPPARRRAWIPIVFHVVLAVFLWVFASRPLAPDGHSRAPATATSPGEG